MKLVIATMMALVSMIPLSVSASEKPISTITPSPIPTPAIDYAAMTDDEFKTNCYELWYDDVIFGDVDDLEGKLCRLELFVESIEHVDPFVFLDDITWSDLREKYNVSGLQYISGVKREPGSLSYVGQPIIMVESDKYDCHIPPDVYGGDHLVVYGEIIHATNNGWTGYNYIIFTPRILTNYGQ